ncbi:MAG TPA: sugar ABC transporter permease, partial [Candidatus Dormibacteraeota bacterium]|nr:sugar ABC transporter permease [Candidatus Dormibacteraeota bacterium]
VFPVALELWYSVSDAQVGELGRFVGLANYIYLFRQPTYYDALRNTCVYAVATIIIKALLGMAIALAIAHPFRGRRLVYALLFLPLVFPMTMGTMAWYYLFSNVHGALNYILIESRLVPAGVDWLGSFGPLPMASLITVNVWHETGLFSVLLLAGLRAIGSEIIDSARVEGATSSQRFLHIVLPLLRPALVLGAALSIMGSFGDFAIVHVLTNGGPANHTQTIPHMAFMVAVRDGNVGVGGAVALTLLPAYVLMLAYLLRTAVRR